MRAEVNNTDDTVMGTLKSLMDQMSFNEHWKMYANSAFLESDGYVAEDDFRSGTELQLDTYADTVLAVMMEASVKVLATVVIIGVSMLLLSCVKAYKVRIDDEPPIVAEEREPEEDFVNSYDDLGDEEEEEPPNPVVYMAFGRVKDHHILASWNPEADAGTVGESEATFGKLMKAAHSKLKAGDKNKLVSKGFNFYFFYESGGGFMAGVTIVDKQYQDKHAYASVADLMKQAMKIKRVEIGHDDDNLQISTKEQCHAGAMTDTLSGTFSELFAKYKNPEANSAMGKALGKMSNVKNQMQSATATVKETDQAYNELEKTSHTMDAFAKRFEEHSEVAVYKQQVERCKLYITYFITLFDIVSLVVIWALL